MTEDQHEHYRKTASQYDTKHNRGEHNEALNWFIKQYSTHSDSKPVPRSYLEVGCGTGLRLIHAIEAFKESEVVGLGPYQEELDQAKAKGVSPEKLIVGKAQALQFEDNHFDVVSMYGVLHHIPQSEQLTAVKEAIRVASECVFISDRNAFGHGSQRVRRIKWIAHRTGLWRPLTLFTTQGKGYHKSETDGISYPFNNRAIFDYLQSVSKNVMLLQTLGKSGNNLWNDATHIAMLAWL